MEKTIIDTEILETKLEDLDLSIRAYNCLKRAGCETVRDILNRGGEEYLLQVRNLGRKSTDEVLEKLKSLGVDLENTTVITAETLLAEFEEKDWEKVLKSLPAKSFVKNSPELAIIAEAMTKYLNKEIDTICKGLFIFEGVTEQDYEKSKQEIIEELDTYKKIVDEKREKYEKVVAVESFASGLKAKVGEIRHYHHTPTQNKHEGHTHNPFDNEREL